MLAAQHIGLSTCPVASPVSFVGDLIRKELKLPETEELYVCIAVGYEDPSYTPDEYAKLIPSIGTRKSDNVLYIE
jgi:nitroreductase